MIGYPLKEDQLSALDVGLGYHLTSEWILSGKKIKIRKSIYHLPVIIAFWLFTKGFGGGEGGGVFCLKIKIQFIQEVGPDKKIIIFTIKKKKGGGKNYGAKFFFFKIIYKKHIYLTKLFS